LNTDYLSSTNTKPLVSVICLCYNQAAYVQEALFSVINQTYQSLELIVVDDASSDHSVSVIQEFIQKQPHILFLVNEQNIGNCRSFNKALAHAKGRYIIDLAADDVLLDTRIEKQVSKFETLDASYGVIFTNALYINAQSQVISYHYPVDKQGHVSNNIPTGDVYEQILRRYFICTPTMMMRKSLLDELGGYDENLSYEDFDFWVRSARNYKYYYLDEVLTLKRKVAGSLSTKFYQVRLNQLLASTLLVCRKASALNRTQWEQQALAMNVRYHLRQSFYTENFTLVFEFNKLLEQTGKRDFITQVILFLSTYKIPVAWLYKLYLGALNKYKSFIRGL
jgi:glycosyltransferase involved in cell wall biosynthesis